MIIFMRLRSESSSRARMQQKVARLTVPKKPEIKALLPDHSSSKIDIWWRQSQTIVFSRMIELGKGINCEFSFPESLCCLDFRMNGP